MQWKLCKVAIPLSGDRVVARLVAQTLLGPSEKKTPESENLANDFSCRGNARCLVLFLGTFLSVLRPAWWEMLPGAGLL